MDLKLRVAICDDEKYFREEIKRLVEQYLKEKKIIFCIDFLQVVWNFAAMIITCNNMTLYFSTLE